MGIVLPPILEDLLLDCILKVILKGTFDVIACLVVKTLSCEH